MEQEVAFNVILSETCNINENEVSIRLLQRTDDEDKYIVESPDSDVTSEFILGVEFRETFVPIEISESPLSSKKQKIDRQISCNICGSISDECAVLKSDDLFETTEESVLAFVQDSKLEYEGGMPPSRSVSFCNSCVSDLSVIIDQILDDIDPSKLVADAL